jgi:hypothetical protein
LVIISALLKGVALVMQQFLSALGLLELGPLFG